MPLQSKQDLTVFIVGAGLGGLMTAILLERAGIKYQLFEKAATVTPLGSVLTLNANILPLFKQLGMLEDLMKISLPVVELEVFNVKMKSVACIDTSEYAKQTGYSQVAFGRPELYDLMLKHIPAHKIAFNKRVLDVKKDEDGRTTITCWDNSQYQADVVIGADGAYSAIRQIMFRDLSKIGRLPEVDKQDLKTVRVGVFGVTDELDPEQYPDLKNPKSKFTSISGGGLNWIAVSLPGNRLSWGATQEAEIEKVQRDKLAASSWGADQADDLIKVAKDLPIPLGGTLGDLIAKTPRDRISKVMLEEKLFETWYHDRMVLIGDACHKMTPGAGLGAVSAMQDAVALVNGLVNLDRVTPGAITEVFEDYKRERYARAKAQINQSRQQHALIFAQTKFQEAMRWIILGLIPESVQRKSYIASAMHQPQASFLPLAVGNPNFKVEPQIVLKRYGTPKSAATA